jgi:hypothetical protein
MCVSFSAATVYAVGQCNLRIAGDTKVGPSSTQFGFGAQIVVSAGSWQRQRVYMIGVEIYADSNIQHFGVPPSRDMPSWPPDW